MQTSSARRVAFTGVLFALALVLSWAEALLTPLLGLPPGVKIGLANIVVMYALLCLSAWPALLLVLLKAAFAFMTRGLIAAALSAAGGGLSLLVMLLVLPLCRRGKAGLLLLSVLGALSHNAGQLLVVRLLFGQPALYYAPILAVSGIVMGGLTAASLRVLLPPLQRLGLAGGRAAK